MKKGVFVLALATLFLSSGCSFKSGGVDLGEPKSVYMGDKAYAKVYLKGATDARGDKNIGVIKDKNGAVTAIVSTVTNIEKWSDVAFEKEMRAAGFVPVSKESDGDFSYSLTLTKLGAEYLNGVLTGKNLKLKMDLTVKIESKNGVVTKNYKYDEQKWVKPMFDSEEIKKELLPFMQEGIAATVKDLVALSKTK